MGNNLNFSSNLLSARKRLGITQEALAEATGIARITIANWENGRKKPSMDMIKPLSLALGITSDELLGIESKSAPSQLLTNSIKNIVESDDFKVVLDHLGYDIIKK
jgi:transcriptional regulator with XRE-family HTH domain